MVEKAKTESPLVARRGGALLGPVKSSGRISKKTSSSSPTKRKSSTPVTPATPTVFKGVRMRTWGKWVTEIRDPETRNRIWLGSFSTPEMAARAYDAAVVCLKGKSAIASLNFPDSPPQIPHQSSMSPKDIQAVAAAAATSSVPAAKPLFIPPTQYSPEASTLYPFGSLDLSGSLHPSGLTSDDHQGITEVKNSITTARPASDPPQMSCQAAEEEAPVGDSWFPNGSVESLELVDVFAYFPEIESSLETDNRFNSVADLWT